MGPGRPPFANHSTPELVRAAVTVFAAFWAVQIYDTVGNHPVLAWLYVPLVLLCAFRVTLFALLFAGALVVNELYEGALPVADAGLASQAVLLAVWARRGALLRGTQHGPAGAAFYRRVTRMARPCLLAVAAALGLSVLLRDTPALTCLLWSVSASSVACAIPATAPFTWRGAASTAALTGVSSAVAFFILEFGARLLIPAVTPPAQVTVYDPDTWWTLGANASGEFEFPDSPLGAPRTVARYSVSTSAQGFRDREFGPKQPGEFRILLLGDSFVYGWGLNEDDMISRRLEAHLNAAGMSRKFTVINGGVEGYGPWQERIRLNKQGFALQPDLVILQVFPANDIDNSLAKVGKHMAAYSPQWQQTLRGRRHWAAWQVRAHEWTRRHSAVYNALVRATGDPALLIGVLDRIRFLAPSGAAPAKPSVNRPYWIEVQLKDWYPDLTEGLAIMESDILAVRDDCRAHAVEFLAFAVPDINSVCDSSWEWNMTRVEDPSIYERGTDVRVAQDFFAREGIGSIGLPAAFASAPDPCALYYENDGHLTPAGAALAAQTIADRLLTNGASALTHQERKL